MIIKEKTPNLFLRLTNFKEYDYINEHKKCLENNGFVWILKVGKFIDKEFLESIIKNGGGIILKTPKRTDNKYYFCKLESYRPYNEKIVFPDYYKEYLESEGLDLNTTLRNENWLKISSMIELSDSQAEKFVTIKSQNKVVNCVRSRAVFMYIENSSKLEIGD